MILLAPLIEANSNEQKLPKKRQKKLKKPVDKQGSMW